MLHLALREKHFLLSGWEVALEDGDEAKKVSVMKSARDERNFNSLSLVLVNSQRVPVECQAECDAKAD